VNNGVNINILFYGDHCRPILMTYLYSEVNLVSLRDVARDGVYFFLYGRKNLGGYFFKKNHLAN